MKKYFLVSFFILLQLFLNCEPLDNCITNIQFKRLSDKAPGPDLIIFKITSNEKNFEKYFEEHGLIEVIFNNKKTFKTDVFEINKMQNSDYELKVLSPYFSIIDYYTDEQIYSLFDGSSNMIINVTLNNKTFVFTKC